MKPRNRAEVLALIARVLMGVWFTYSGGYKLWVSGLDRFTRDIANYQLLPPPLDAWVAYTVPWLELVAGLCLMLSVWRRGAITVLAALVAGFSVFIGWAWSQQLDIACGCHGTDGPIRYWGKAVELTAYFVVLGWLWGMERDARNHRSA